MQKLETQKQTLNRQTLTNEKSRKETSTGLQIIYRKLLQAGNIFCKERHARNKELQEHITEIGYLEFLLVVQISKTCEATHQ